MGKKLHWNKTYSDRYLADRELNQLTFLEHGLLQIINCILRTQTDRVGCYIIRDRIGTREELIKHARRHAHGSHKMRDDVAMMGLCTLTTAALLEQDVDGMIYSPYICEEVAESKINTIRGKLGGSPRLSTPVNPPLKPEKKRRDKKREEGEVKPAAPRTRDRGDVGPISIHEILKGEK
ncbi:MAG: hypothetical protein GY906_17940 [bacterium]|nr:hypothetical protein [bacterium]